LKFISALKIIVYALMTAFLLLYLFIAVPNLNPMYASGAFFWAMLITVNIVIWALFKFGEFTYSSFGSKADISYVPKRKFPIAVKILAVAPWAFFAAMMFISSPIISWKQYRDQLGVPEKNKFTSDIQAIDISQIPIVDISLAQKLADKELGTIPSLGSQVVLGEPTIQMVDGKLVWAVPLYHSGIFKWLTNMSGTPGYVLVSATNVNDVKYVDGFKVKYQPNSFFFDDLTRYVRFKGNFFKGLTDYSFELDDSGQPYWVISTYKNTRGFSLEEATGVITVNATTGELNEYPINEIPSWVDRVQPASFITNQINNSGEYVKGIFNFADSEKFQTSEGYAIVYNNGRCFYFTGLTSVGADESAIGFMLVDMVTKKPYLYQMSGATEYSAQNSAMGKVQHLGYTASFPLVININDIPTYFMTLKDREGLIKQYAFVSVANYSIVGTGENIQSALKNYQENLRYDNSSQSIGKPIEKTAVSGTVLRIASETIQDETVYKIILSEEQNKIFIVAAQLSQELALTVAGDSVAIEYEKTGSPIANATSFYNLQFSQK